jgi:hypothetical protein
MRSSPAAPASESTLCCKPRSPCSIRYAATLPTPFSLKIATPNVFLEREENRINNGFPLAGLCGVLKPLRVSARLNNVFVLQLRGIFIYPDDAASKFLLRSPRASSSAGVLLPWNPQTQNACVNDHSLPAH